MSIDIPAPGLLPGGADTDVQFNNAGVFGGDDYFTYTSFANGGPYLAIGGVGSAFPNTASLSVADDANINTYNFRSIGNTKRNLISGKLETRGHSGFGSRYAGGAVVVNPDVTITVDDRTVGDIGLNSAGISVINQYTVNGPTVSNMTGVNVFISLLAASVGDAAILTGVAGIADNESGANVQTVGGGSFGVVNGAGATVTGNLVGVSGQVTNNSGVVGVLPYAAAITAGLSFSGTQPTTNGYGILVSTNTDAGGSIVNNYGIFLATQAVGTTKIYNLWSDWDGIAGRGKNYLGAGAQIGATDLNISRIGAGQLGIGTGAAGSVAGTLRAAGIGIAGAITGGEVLTATGAASVSTAFKAGTVAIAGAAIGGDALAVTGSARISTSFAVGTTSVFTGAVTATAGITVGTAAQIVSSNVALTNGAAAQVATLTNGPAAGNPTKWIGVNDNGTVRYVPSW